MKLQAIYFSAFVVLYVSTGWADCGQQSYNQIQHCRARQKQAITNTQAMLSRAAGLDGQAQQADGQSLALDTGIKSLKIADTQCNEDFNKCKQACHTADPGDLAYLKKCTSEIGKAIQSSADQQTAWFEQSAGSQATAKNSGFGSAPDGTPGMTKAATENFMNNAGDRIIEIQPSGNYDHITVYDGTSGEQTGSFRVLRATGEQL